MNEQSRLSGQALGVAGLLACVLLASGCAGNNDVPAGKLYLIVTREVFAKAMQPLLERRRAEGYEVVVSFQPPDQAIRALLPRRPDLLLLIGDEQYIVKGRVLQEDSFRTLVVADDKLDATNYDWYVPAKWEKHYRWLAGHQREFASDAAWGDLDGDRRPDIPVGRLPVRTPAQLRRIVDKILEYERQPPSLNDLRLPICAGDPMPNSARDGVAWAMLGKMSTELLLQAVKADAPRWAEIWLLSASANQPLRGWPHDFPDLFSGQLQQGGLLALLVGHGSQEAYYFLSLGEDSIRYTAENASAGLGTGRPAPPLFISACSCGDFTGLEDCLAESLLRMPGGPVAVLASTTISDSVPEYLWSRSVLQMSRPGAVRRLGEFWLEAQRRMPVERNLILEKILLSSGDKGYLGGKPDLDKLRLDGQLWSALLGDPATRLRLPQRLEAKVRRNGTGWQWEARKPRGATKLHVSFRPLQQPWPSAGTVTGKQELRALLQAANATFAFHELPAPPPHGEWKGAVDQEGTLRLVAFTPEALYVEALDLRIADTNPPSTQPSGKRLGQATTPSSGPLHAVGGAVSSRHR